MKQICILFILIVKIDFYFVFIIFKVILSLGLVGIKIQESHNLMM